MENTDSKVYVLVILLLSVILALALLLPSVSSILSGSSMIRSSGNIVHLSPLHVDGKYLKDDLGSVIYLRGCGKIHWDDDPTGWWWPQGGAWYQNYLTWDPNAVRYQLQQMKSWGMNVVRFHTVADWWIQDNVTVGSYVGSYRNNLKQTFAIAQQLGMYVIMDLFNPTNFARNMTDQGISSLPFPPYSTALASSVIGSKQAFADYWGNVANELGGYFNVLFELYNEPNTPSGFNVTTARNDWFNAVQMAIDSIRSKGATNMIVVQWEPCAVPYLAANAGNLYWVENYPLNDSTGNILYSTHLYRTYYNPNWYNGYEYNYTLAAMENCEIKYIVDTLNKPLIIGEIGVNTWSDNVTKDSSGLTELQKELAWATNVLNICNQWGISYSAWDWTITDRWCLISLDGLPKPSAWGQVLIEAIAEGGTHASP